GRLAWGADMDWRVRNERARPAATPTRRGDGSSWKGFSTQVTAGVKEAAGAGVPLLVIDLSGLEYMTSKGLRALTMAKNEAKGAVTLQLAAPNATMRRILSISRYDMLFPVVDHVGQAG